MCVCVCVCVRVVCVCVCVCVHVLSEPQCLLPCGTMNFTSLPCMVSLRENSGIVDRTAAEFVWNCDQNMAALHKPLFINPFTAMMPFENDP